MQLDESLQICLLALASRYPEHVVDINEDVLGPQAFETTGWSAHGMITQLGSAAPHLLRKRARLIVDAQKTEIYLLEYSERVPALLVHCRGKIPITQPKLAALAKR